MAITGLSMAARAVEVSDRAEAQRIIDLLPSKYPEQKAMSRSMPKAGEVRIFRVTPTVISVLDYSKGFGHTELVNC